MTCVAEFSLDLSGPKSFDSKEMSHCALLELAHRTICTLNIFVMARFSGFAARQSSDITFPHATLGFRWCPRGLVGSDWNSQLSSGSW
jgi:hypothetical protein